MKGYHNRGIMMSTKFKYGARIIAILITACMIFASVPPIEASAASMTDRTYVDSMTIGNNAEDIVTITKVEPFVLNVSCTHSLAYDGMDIRAYEHGTNTYSVKPQYVKYGLGAGESWEKDFYFTAEPGDHKLVVYKNDGGNYKPYVDRITVEVTESGVKLIDYSAIREQNTKIRASGSSVESYKNTSLQDFKYMLFNKEGSTSSSTRRDIKDSTESDYYKKIADSIISAEDSDYTKLRKLYAYVADKLYYDNYKTKAPYDDPYYNLRHINKLGETKGYNWSSGKVAAQCDGYAGLYIALVRSQGIPARMVSGNLLSSSGESWENEAKKSGGVKRTTHCWVQAYVDGRWIEIDPCRATLNKRNSDGTWTKERQINYMFFDMNDVQMAHTHCSVGFEGDLGAISSSKSSQTITTGASKYTKTIGNKAFNLNAKAKTTKTYKSSNTKVVTVSSKGLVTIKGTGKATITVTAKSSSKYNSATKKVTVTVKPKQVTNLKLTKAKKSFTAKWSKATGASGYQVAYTTDKNFKKNIKTTTTTSLKKTVKSLTAKKTYYVKVRAYKKASDGTKVYGSYSAKKSIKTK